MTTEDKTSECFQIILLIKRLWHDDLLTTWFVCVFPLSQMYVHHGIHDLIFNFVGTLEANQVGVSACLPHF